MNKAILSFTTESIFNRIGVRVRAHDNSGDFPSMDIVPADAHPNDSFAVRFSPRWRSAEAEFIPGKFAAPLISQMGKADISNKSIFTAFAYALDSRRTHLTFRVNGIDVSPLNIDNWPDNWNRIELLARSTLQVIEPGDLALMRRLTIELVVPVFGMIAALVGVEGTDTLFNGESEGSPIQMFNTRYERKKVNREACIQLKGLRCVACGFDFGTIYGQIGTGYIEVHHVTPVSQIGSDYKINVMSDLEPLCANCHAMVHRNNPPILISELTRIIANQKGGQK